MDAESQSRRDEALIQAGLILASELSLPAVLQKIVELACRVADARYGALGVIGADGRIEEFITHGVTEAERRAIGDPPHGHGILGVLISDTKPLRLRRIQDHEKSYGFPAHHPPMRSFLGVPVKIRDRVFGNLYLTEKLGAEEFTEMDERATVTLAAQAAVAIENARLYAAVRESERRVAVVEDRERIARELHDGVVQSLFAVGMALQATEAVAEDTGIVRQRIGAAVDDIDRVIRDLRNYIFALRPGEVADRLLVRSLEDLAEDYSQSIPIGVDIDTGAAALLAPHATDIVQAAREALSNAVRHSGADRVEIRLQAGDGTAVLEVVDNGSGFDQEGTSTGGQGLGNLRARATALRGSLMIDSATGKGTTVRITVPI